MGGAEDEEDEEEEEDASEAFASCKGEVTELEVQPLRGVLGTKGQGVGGARTQGEVHGGQAGLLGEVSEGHLLCVWKQEKSPYPEMVNFNFSEDSRITGI